MIHRKNGRGLISLPFFVIINKKIIVADLDYGLVYGGIR